MAMKDVLEAKKFIKENLGQKAASHFAHAVDDFFCYIKHKAIFDPCDDVRASFESVASGIITDSVKIFVGQNYVSDAGRLELHISNDEFLDKAMMPVAEIITVKQKSHAIVKLIVTLATEDYERGRVLAFDISSRMKKYEEKFVGPHVPETPPLDLSINPPMEMLEIEMMRLERRLPALSNDEGNRLSQLYVLLKVTAKAH